MEQIPTEDLKLLAEALDLPNIKVTSYDGQQIQYRTHINQALILFHPTESADQCLMVLEWLDKNGALIIDNVGESDWCIAFEGENTFHKDFKTAVTLASIKYIKQ